MKIKLALFSVLISLAFSTKIMPQSGVHLFQNFLNEASVSSKPFVSGYLINHGRGFLNTCDYNIQAGYPLSNSLEARMSFGSGGLGKYSNNKVDASFSGIYNVLNSNYQVSIGAFVTLPLVGNVKPNNKGYGIFGTLKKTMTDKIVLTADAGLDIRNQSSVTKSLFIGAGAIMDAYEKLAVIAEAQLWAEDTNTFIMSVGLDYKLIPGFSLRGVMGLNMLDARGEIRALIGASYSL